MILHDIRPTQIYVIGDSQCLIFGDRVRISPTSCGYGFRSIHLALHAGELADEAGKLSEPFVDAMVCTRLLLRVNGGLIPTHAALNDGACSQ